MDIKTDYSIKHLNTFGIDVKAKHYAEVNDLKDIMDLFNKYSDQSRIILGGGSNLLFTGDFDGFVIKNNLKGIQKVEENDDFAIINAGAGEDWDGFVRYCVENNYGGIENLSLIPGTVGASPIQNIGAYGVEIKDVFHSLQGIDTWTWDLITLEAQQCSFGYRDSIFKREYKNKFVILSVSFRLSKNPVPNLRYEALKNEFPLADSDHISIKDVREAVCRVRRSKLPDPALLGNAGSFFKNPEISKEHHEKLLTKFNDLPSFDTPSGNKKIPAGWLIQKCGWKGKRVGNVGVYEKQALVLVNYGGAIGKEVLDLAMEIKDSVLDKFDILLEMEVNII